MNHKAALTALFAATVVLSQPQTVPILTETEIQGLENTIAKSPGDTGSKTLLAKNYAFLILGIAALDQFGNVTNCDPAKAKSAYAAKARAILNATKDPVMAGEGGGALWRYGDRFRAWWIYRGEPHSIAQPEKEFAEALIERAVSLDPGNKTWRRYQQAVLRLRGTLPAAPGNGVFQPMKENVAAIGGDKHLYLLSDVAKQALKESKFDEAKAVADEMLALVAKSPENPLSGRATYEANLVLGTVALKRKDVKSACAYLLAAGAAKGEPSLGSFGPNLKLAKDLLDAGERDTVLEFFRLMSGSWPREREQFAKWSIEVRDGKSPNFGVYLFY